MFHLNLEVHVVSVVFLQRLQELVWNHNFKREAVWLTKLQDHAQASIGLFPDVCPLTNCLIFPEKGDHNKDPQMCGGCSGCGNGNRPEGHMSAELVLVNYTHWILSFWDMVGSTAATLSDLVGSHPRAYRHLCMGVSAVQVVLPQGCVLACQGSSVLLLFCPFVWTCEIFLQWLFHHPSISFLGNCSLICNFGNYTPNLTLSNYLWIDIGKLGNSNGLSLMTWPFVPLSAQLYVQRWRRSMTNL